VPSPFEEEHSRTFSESCIPYECGRRHISDLIYIKFSYGSG
jgi:hypothetical protein